MSALLGNINCIIRKIKEFLPKPHNKFAGAIIFGGLALMAGPPLIEKIILIFVNQTINASLTDNDQMYGFGLVLWGSIYHIIMSRLLELTNAVSGAEKRKTRLSLIADCRVWLNQNNFNRRDFCETDIYSRIRPYLKDKLIDELEKDPDYLTIRTGSARGAGVDNYKSEILDELVKLEHAWELI